MEYITHSSQETQELGQKLSADLKGGEVIALSGDLGAGKTTFVQGIAKGLGISARVNSPTFIIMRTYQFGEKTLYHVDLYRIESNVEAELVNLGITDLWGKPENIFIIEWAERASDFLPQNTRKVHIENSNENVRKITTTQ